MLKCEAKTLKVKVFINYINIYVNFNDFLIDFINTRVYIKIKTGGNMMIKVLTKCPVCDGNLNAVKLKCQSCSTIIENTFDFPKLMSLSREQLEFVEVFIKSRGNIKDVERELGISYPTVRAKLDQVIELLEGPSKRTMSQTGNSSDKQKEVIERLERGEITPEEAIELMK